ncbi:hypothetical protein [Jannaschia sp. CCS1]|uniref:hypothetical protein n=1 Tax=Jannaschia sp. (strain CCS1) TaxID=290400 RepID=UPI000053A5A2|nr:hypothetical protein [Jannaschia sp. CCS1]ABD55412.1 hypothetical protein Jann_2495 [Jannaschia sp. CCS1]
MKIRLQMLDMWPFFILIALFIGFSLYLARAMGSGKEGSYTSLMKRQNELMEAQISVQMEMLAEMRRQSDALETSVQDKRDV